MAAEEDGDVFEITDFTTASDWERFIARLEEVLHEWKLVNRDPLPTVPTGKYTEGPWEEKTEDLMFADFKFVITYTRLKIKENAGGESRSSREREEAEDDQVEDEHKTPTVMNDIISMDNDFPSRAHCLCRWYGLQEFLVIQSAPNFAAIDSESRAKLLESSASIALSNSACHVPVFVQMQQKWRKLYGGIAVVPGANVMFEMSHLKKLPPRYLHLDGLLNVFKSKLGCEYVSMPPVSVSVRFTYILEDWIHCPWPQLPPDFSSFSEGEVGCTELDVLPFGACEDPVSELHLSCTWPYLSAEMIIETSGYSDLDPLQAPQWSVRIQMTEDPQCLLGQYLRAFIELCTRTETTDEILGHVSIDVADQTEKDSGEDITNALQRLTEPNLPYHIPSLGTVVSRATTRLRLKPDEAPIPPKLLNQILLHLFPDATGLAHSLRNKRRSSKEKESKDSTPLEENPPPTTTDRMEEVLSEALKQLKSASPDSLTYKLATCMLIINFNYGGLRAIAHLWQEFILEMRYRWENNILIPDLGAGSSSSSSKSQTSSTSSSSSPAAAASTSHSGSPAPNLGSCLIHQKLQMLNCCIERKIKREASGYGHESTVLHEAASTSVFETDQSVQIQADEVDESKGGGGDSVARKARSVGSSSDDDDDEFFECNDGDAGGDNDNNGGEGEDDGGDEKDDEDIADSATADVVPKRLPGTSSATRKTSKTSSSSSSTKKKASLISEKSMDSTVSEASFKDAVQMKAEGRLAPLKNMRSLTTNEQLFIPVTQEPSPMTEDMLEEQAEVLAKLGSSAEGSQLRARMQSACLLSDMESFKAANPGCCLEDFVRWYSPRDFIEADEDEGEGGMGSGQGQGEEAHEKGQGHDEEGQGRNERSQRQSKKGRSGSSADAEREEKEVSEADGKKEQTSEKEDEGSDELSDTPTSSSPKPSDEKSYKPDDASEKEAEAGDDEKDTDTATPTSSSPSAAAAAASATTAASYDMPFTEKSVSSPKACGGRKRTESSCSTGPHHRKGRLSQRMQIPGNMWVEVWQSARPMTARRQKRLFDDTKEAEKVLHFLSGLRPGEIVLHMLPMVTHACILKLVEKEDPEVPVLKTLTDQVLAKAVKVTRGVGIHAPDVKRYEDVVRMIELAETVSSRAQSLKTKLTRDLLEKGKAEEELHKFVSSLLQQPEVDVKGAAYGPAGSAIHRLFVAAQRAALMIVDDDDEKEVGGGGGASAPAALNNFSGISDPSKSSVHDFPSPSAREYILRAMVPRPAPFSRVLPQRMYCVMVEGDYRLAGAFAADTTFQ